ncbi:MAG TPA: hypothetical protein VF277_03400 [Steroidobacteraceae bacterium]
MLKTRTLAAALAALTLISPLPSAFAQVAGSPNDDTQLLISQIQSDKRAVVLQAMNLTDAEVKAFTPIYDAYQKDNKVLFEQGGDLLNKYASNYDSMTDDAAKGILKDFFKLKDNRQSLLKSYAKKVGKVLPAAKVLRWVQVENKLNTLLDVQAARIVPLTK